MFGGEILCGCYAQGTDSKRECYEVPGNPSSLQCPCLADIGNQTKAGAQCVSSFYYSVHASKCNYIYNTNSLYTSNWTLCTLFGVS